MAMFRQPLMSLTRSSTTRFVACPSLIALESRQRRGAHSKHAFTAAPVELSYDEFGPEVHEDGRPAPIVILHGLFGSKRNWRSIAKSLAQKSKRHIYTLDLRNHGSSPQTPEMNYDAMASDVAHFIQSKTLPPVSLVGHSMGGKVAMHLALKQSKLTSELVAVDIAPVAMKTSPAFEGYVRAMKHLTAAKPEDLKQANEILEKEVPVGVFIGGAWDSEQLPLTLSPSLKQEKAVRAFLLTNFVSDKVLGHLVPILNLDVISDNLANIFDFPEARHPTSHYHKPCLFLAGAKSHYVDPAHRDTYAQLFPTVEIHMIQGAGHWVHSEKPHEFQDALLDFFGRHEKGTITTSDKERYTQHTHHPHDRRGH